MGLRGIYLKTARRRARLTQAALAARIGKPQSLISKLENGTLTDPSVTTVKALGKALGVDPLALRFGPTRRERVEAIAL